MKTIFRILSLICLCGWLAGCNTPASRIDRNLELFNSLPAADQQLIQQGKIAVGFTPPMVKLALGEPDRIYQRTDADGASESWVYTTYVGTAGAVYYGGFYHRRHPGLYPMWFDASDRRELDRFKVVFKNGKVTLIEEMTRS